MARTGSTGISRAGSSTLEQGRSQGSGHLQSQGSVPNHAAEGEDDVFLTAQLPLKPLKKWVALCSTLSACRSCVQLYHGWCGLPHVWLLCDRFASCLLFCHNNEAPLFECISPTIRH